MGTAKPRHDSPAPSRSSVTQKSCGEPLTSTSPGVGPGGVRLRPHEVRPRPGRRGGLQRQRLEAVQRAEHGVAAFDDRRLLGEDRLARVAQHLRVFQADAREHHHRRRDHVGGVQTAAQPGLQGQRLDAAAREGQQRRHGEHLELRGLAQLGGQAGHRLAHALHAGAQQLVVHGPARHHHAFVPAEMCGDR